MAEIIGAMSASLHLAEILSKYCRSFKSASADVANLAEEVAAIGQVLQTLQQSVQNSSGGPSFLRTSSLLSSIQSCERRMQALEASLAPHVSKLGKLFKRAKWPLHQLETVETVQALHRFVQIFHFASTSDGLAALSLPISEAVQRLENLQQSHDASHRDVADALRLLPQVELQISGLTKKFDNFVVGVESHTQSQADKERTKAAYHDLCQMLAKIPTAEFEDRHRTLQLTRMKGGSRWIFDAPNYVAWRNGSSTNTLWCNGGPGVGKTYLASVVIDELFVAAKAATNDYVVSFFYFDYNKQVDQTPLRVLQTLLHQILSTHSRIPPVAEKMAEDLMVGKPLPSWKDIQELFINLCSDGRPVFIVLDALDECDAVANRKPILELIKAIKTSPARLLVTSRPYPPDVDEVLGDCPQVLVEASDKDIEKYVLEQIEENVEMRRMLDDGLKRVIVDSILDKSQGMFLLPALQINNILGQTNVDEVRAALKMLPSGLADNLTMTIDRIKKQHSQNQTRSRLAFSVLQWLSTVRRPITTAELQHALAAQPGMEQLNALTDPRFFVESCFGLTIIDKETSVVRLVHFSVKEFLQLKRDDLFDDPDSALTASCLTYMAVCIKKDRKLVQETTESRGSLLVRQWPFWEYAASLWGLHAASSCVGPAETGLKDFAFSQDLLDTWAGYMCCAREAFKDEPRYRRVQWQNYALLIGSTTSPVHIAAIYDLPGLAQEYLARGLPANQRDGNGATALIVAVANAGKHVGVLKMLFSTAKDLDLNILDNEGRSALYHAANSGNLSVFRYLLRCRGIDVNTGRVLEAVSTYSNSETMFELLLAHRKFNLHKTPHSTVIESVAELAREERPQYLRILLGRPDFHIREAPYEDIKLGEAWHRTRNVDYQYMDFGEDHDHILPKLPSMFLLLDKTFPNQSGFEAMTTLFSFVYYAYAGFYRHPLGNGDKTDADSSGINSMDIDWPTEEAVAALATEGYIPSSLVAPGDDPNIYGVNFWDDADEPQRTALRARMQSEGISFATRDSKGRGFIHAVSAKAEDMWTFALIFLLRTGADPNMRDNTGQTPLHYATACGNEKAVDLLLAAGADPCAADNDGWTVLHSAAKGSSMDVLTRLVGLGADVLALTVKNVSVLHIAVEKSKEPRAMINFLIDKGCGLDAACKAGYTPGYSSIWGPIEALTTCLELGQDPFTYKLFGNTMLLTCVTCMLPAETGLCLSYLPTSPSSPGTELNRVGSFGMSVLDYLSQFDRSVADTLGFTEHHWATHIPTPPAMRRRHLVYFFLYRVFKMLLVEGDAQRDMLERGAHQLLHLGDERSAVIMLEQFLVPESRAMAVPFVRGTYCSGCDGKDAPLFKCRVCPLVTFCAACRDAMPRKGYNDAKQCEGHQFVEFPGRGWKRLEEGKVNGRGQTFTEFLERLKARYARELGAISGG